MHLKEIQFENFRNFKKLKINFHPKINLIYGYNGQGKTSLLEAVYYLSITKSFRAKNDSVVLNHNGDFFNIQGNFSDQKNIESNVRIYFSKQEGKHAFVNTERVKSFSEIVGLFPVIMLSLEDIEITYGVPAVRRKFLDVLLSQLYPQYLHNLQKYKKCVLQKNKLLNTDKNVNIIKELQLWNRQIIQYGSEILFKRLKFIEYLNKNISSVYDTISGKKEIIEAQYYSTIGKLDKEYSVQNICVLFEEILSKVMDKELQRQNCLVGPHRDDLDFMKDSYPLKSHGSHGENKSFLLALKFLESQYILDVSQKKPLMLLDDIFGELDTQRSENLLKVISDQGQTFITTTDNKKFKNIIIDDESLIHIHNNSVLQ